MANSTPENEPSSDDEEQYYANRLLLIILLWLGLVLSAGTVMVYLL